MWTSCSRNVPRYLGVAGTSGFAKLLSHKYTSKVRFFVLHGGTTKIIGKGSALAPHLKAKPAVADGGSSITPIRTNGREPRAHIQSREQALCFKAACDGLRVQHNVDKE